MTILRTRSIVVGAALTATLALAGGGAFAAGAFDSGARPIAVAVAATDCSALLAQNHVNLPPAMQTALATASSDSNSLPGCALQVGGSAPDLRTEIHSELSSDCWALLQRDKVKLPAAAQTALAVASADPNSHPGCAIMVGP